MRHFTNFKTKILAKATDEDILNQLGYCYKRALIDQFDKESYWTKCYTFLTKLCKKKGLKPYC